MLFETRTVRVNNLSVQIVHLRYCTKTITHHLLTDVCKKLPRTLPVVRIRPHFDSRTHFGSQVEFCGLCSSLTCTPSAPARLSGYDRAFLPRIVHIFVLERWYAAVASRTKLRSKGRGVTNTGIPFISSPFRPAIWLVGLLFAGDRQTISYLVISSTDNILPSKASTRGRNIAGTYWQYPLYRTPKCLKWKKAESAHCVKNPKYCECSQYEQYRTLKYCPCYYCTRSTPSTFHRIYVLLHS